MTYYVVICFQVNLKEQGQLLRQGEFQVWEGGRGKKTTRHVFLFEDLILFSKARKDPEKRVHYTFISSFSLNKVVTIKLNAMNVIRWTFLLLVVVENWIYVVGCKFLTNQCVVSYRI